MCLENTIKNCIHWCFEREHWKHVENLVHCLVHFSDKMENLPLLSERGHWQHMENHIHCLMKQQWHYMEIHPVLTKCALTAQEKLHLLMFEREQWQQVENPIHCLVKQQWQYMKIHPVLNKCLESTKITASTDVWKRAVTTCGKPHTLLSETAVTTYRNPSTAC